MSTEIWRDATTGQVVPGYHLLSDPQRGAGMMLYNSPDRQTFMSIGHVLIAMTLGYAGAKFAVVVHRRECSDNEPGNQRTAK